MTATMITRDAAHNQSEWKQNKMELPKSFLLRGLYILPDIIA